MPGRRRSNPTPTEQWDLFALLDLDPQATAEPAGRPLNPPPARSSQLDLVDSPPSLPGRKQPPEPARPVIPLESPADQAAPPPPPAPDRLDRASGTTAPVDQPPPAPTRFAHPGHSTVPASPQPRAAANIAALRVLRALQAEDRHATPQEQQVLAGWSGWGALPHVFDAPVEHDGPAWWPEQYDRLIPTRLAQLAAAGVDVTELRQQLAALRAEPPTSAGIPDRLAAATDTVPSPGVDSPAGRLGQSLVDRLRQVATTARWDPVRAQLNDLTDAKARLAAARSTLNAHYTDPQIAQAMWDALHHLGFQGGPVLEPGCGSGNFIGLAPDAASMVGVELDPTTAAIAAHLYPDSTIVTGGFQAPGWNPGAFAAAVGNVPFGDFRLYDPVYNPRGLSIHNHFLVKALQLTAPGGIVALLTSAYTMDAASSAGRRELHAHGDLLGAVRLPTSAFRSVAGTDVVTDILILRRRIDGETPLPFAEWEKVIPVQTPAGTVLINTWFASHRDLIAGTLTAHHGRYRTAETGVIANPDEPLADAVADRLALVVHRAQQLGLTYAVADTTALPEPRSADAAGWDEDHRPGTIRVEPDGTFTRLDPASRAWTPYRIGAPHRAEARALLELRDQVTELVTAQLTGDSETHREELRSRTRDQYERYVAEYGPINRFTSSTRSAWVLVDNVDPEDIDPDWPTRHRHIKDVPQYTDTGEPILQVRRTAETRQRPPAVEALRSDPGFAAVLALETFDDDTQTASAAPILTRDVLAIPARPEVAATAADALTIVLDRDGTADLAAITALLEGAPSPAQVRERLGELVYDDPQTGGLTPAARYLSGNVRAKLAAAESASQTDARFEVNVRALTAVLPRQLTPADIEARPGVTWVPPSDYVTFVQEVLGCPDVTVSWSEHTGTWEVQAPRPSSRQVQTVYGVPTHNGIDLMVSLMNNSPVNISKVSVDADGREVLIPDPDATEAANAKRAALADRFGTWLWADPDRAERLTGVYNEKFNSWVDPVYDGSHLTLPGLGSTFTPRPTQTAAVARILDQPTVLLDHVVGAGKTGTMVMAAMEQRRLGQARQPWIVVPNHIVEQVAREAKQWYPAARILSAAGETTEAKRREFVALTATGDYDLVIVPETTFTGIPVTTATEAEFLADQVADLRAALSARSDAHTSARARSDTTKRLEAAVSRLETRITALRAEGRAGKDTGLAFEASGCDYVYIDEAHHYKNRMVVSNTRDLARDKDSQRSLDLALKMQVLRRRRAEDGRPDRIATFATGTPVPNSPREMWVMLDFLRPDLLRQAGVEHFDAWAANHLRPQTRLEMKPTGGGFAPKTRITQFVNVPEMSRMWRQMADLVTRDDLPVKLPTLAGGNRITINAPRTPEQAAFAQVLEARAQAVKLRTVRPDEDNILAIGTAGRRAALDQRLVGLPAPADGGRPTAVAEQILRIWRATRDRAYTGQDGQPAPNTGGLQVVFLDQSTPQPGRWSVYRQLQDELTAAGMPRDQVRFIHDADAGQARTDLFTACRDGRVSVLIGSTAKLGTGANIQDRMVALHHVDVPWRPADLEQREGRILRSGNQNDQVEIITYVTENSYDAFSWNLVSTKASFIARIKNGTTARHVDTDDADTASYEQIAAISSGDPRVMERYQLGVDLSALERLDRAHRAEQRSLATEAASLAARLDALAGTIDFARNAVQASIPTAGDQFAAIIDGRHTTKRAEAGLALYHAVAANMERPGRARRTDRVIGSLGGHELRLTARAADPGLALSLPSLADPAGRINNALYQLTPSSLATGEASPGLGAIRRIENLIAALPAHIATWEAELAAGPAQLTEIRALVGAEFPRAGELADIRARITVLDQELAATGSDPNLDPPPPSWAQALPAQDRDQLVWGPRLHRVTADYALAVTDLGIGDVLAAPSTASNPRQITHIDHGNPVKLTVTDLVTGVETVLSKRAATIVGVAARHRDNLNDLEQAIADTVPSDRIIGITDIKPGDHITIHAVDGYNFTLRTLTAATGADQDPRNSRFFTVTDDTGHQHRIADYPDHNTVIRHHTDTAAVPAPTAVPVIPMESPHADPDRATDTNLHPPNPSPPVQATAPEPAHLHGPAPADPSQQPEPAPPRQEPTIQHGRAGTIVTGSSKQDTELRAALKTAGFRWSGSQQFWYLPRTMLEHTRALRVQQLTNTIARSGRTLTITDHPDNTPRTPTAGPATPPTIGAPLPGPTPHGPSLTT